jgi:hypothetical protein
VTRSISWTVELPPTLVVADIPSGDFTNLNGQGAIGFYSTIRHYLGFQSFNYVEYAGHGKYAAKWDKYERDYTRPGNPYDTYLGTEFIGIFDTQAEMQTAVDAAVGYSYGQIFNDYFGGGANRVYGFSYPYVNIWHQNFSRYAETQPAPIKPSYIDLVSGYPLDDRTIPSYPMITLNQNIVCTIQYYQWNKYESYPGLKSINVATYHIDIKKNRPTTLPIYDCVLGTLYCDNNDVLQAIVDNANLPNKYQWGDLLPAAIPSLFAYWRSIPIPLPLPLPDPPIGAYNISTSTLTEVNRIIHTIPANNNIWNNRSNSTTERNRDISHPMYVANDSIAYSRFLNPQNDGSLGDLMVDSPRLIEMHKALNAGKYALNELNPAEQRVTNLGFLIEQNAKLLGLRLDANGDIDRDNLEKAYTRKVLNNNPVYEKKSYGTNCFGLHGRLTPHLTNANGKDAYDVVYDIPQLLEAQFSHINQSLGIQQGTEINIPNAITGKNDYYPNQLAMQLEVLSKLTEIQINSKESFNILSIVSQEVRELFSGIGIPVIFKTLYNRYGSLPFIGHQADKGSIQSQIRTALINIGIISGNMLARPVNRKNPLEKLLFKGKENK